MALSNTALLAITSAGLSPKAQAEHHVRTALRGVYYEDVYPVPCTRNRWQLESFDRFGYIQKRLADIPGITNIVAETDYSTTPPLAMVQFDYVRVLSIADYRATQDTVIGPAGIVPIAEPEDIPAALEATGLIPVPGVPGLDASYHTYMADVDAPSAKALEDAPALPCDEPEPPPAAPALTLRYGQRILPVDAIITGPMGGVYARVNISTTARPMWHHVQYLQGTVVTSRAKAA